MSEVYIRGMEMPKDREIYLRIDEKGEVYVYGQYPTKLYKAIPVSPYGRLIDADLLCKVLKWKAGDKQNKQNAPFSWSYAYECVIDVVNDMPTIIPASKEET